MPRRKSPQGLTKARNKIAHTVRQLRRARGWTQTEFAKRLQLSQSRLSEIEGGDGSFTAEQFLLLLRLFNVPVSQFATEVIDHVIELQNALARLGAVHLRESAEVLPSERLGEVHTAVREALVDGDPRLVTALAPVLVRHAERLNLPKLYGELERTGLERRLAWIVENTLLALESLEHSAAGPREWTHATHRARLTLRRFLELLATEGTLHVNHSSQQDVLDATIRSRRTLDDVEEANSPTSRRWGIVTSLQPEDFLQALRAARAAG